MRALSGIELALEHVNLVKPLTKQDLLGLQGQCVDAPLPFRIRVAPRSARNAIELAAVVVDKEDLWNWNNEIIFMLDVTKGGIQNIECGSLRDHQDSFAGAQMISLAMTVLLRKAAFFAADFERSLVQFPEKRFLESV
jgi:hypothetical protein